ncbi:O-antigen ligase family protein [Streptomyces sp. CA-106131]|uniref:O-antigen ligase family protein n=1 Tax=Streptomyces sp. CA-106131 TaxID=3240045 RepID=UPI003D91F04C
MATGRANMRSVFTVVIGRMGLLAAGPAAAYLALFHGATAAVAAVVICFALVVWPRPDVALLLLLGLVPLAAIIDTGGTVMTAMIGGAVALFLLRTALNGARLRLDLVLILLLALAVGVSCVLPEESFPVVEPWKGCGFLLMGLGLLAASVLAPPDPRRIAQVVAGSGTGVAVYLMVRGEYVSDRLTGLGLNANYLGAFLALFLVATVGMARFHRPWPWLLPAVVCASALLETRSRGALVMAATGLACVLLAGRPLRYKVLAGLAMLAVLTPLTGSRDSVEQDLMGSRASTELTANTEVRKQAALLALRVALDHPLRGIGYAMFPEYARAASSLGIYINTHNDFLRLAAECGLVTCVLLVTLLWLGLARRCATHHAILQALCVSYAVGLFFANTLTYLLASTPFWISLGCLLARSARRKEDPGGGPLTAPSAT